MSSNNNNKNNKNREDFIIQNVTPGPLYVSDIKLSMGPLEVIDLTYRDADEIRASQDLRASLRTGFLRQITRAEAERSADQRTAKMRKDVAKLQQRAKTQTIEVDGKTLEVEPLNVDRTDSGKMSEQVTTAGHANDPFSYTVALEIAQNQAELRGDTLSIEDFYEMVSRDPDLVGRLIKNNTEMITPLSSQYSKNKDDVDSGAYFAQAPDNSGESNVGKQKMSAPDTMKGNKPELSKIAESIDLTKE